MVDTTSYLPRFVHENPRRWASESDPLQMCPRSLPAPRRERKSPLKFRGGSEDACKEGSGDLRLLAFEQLSHILQRCSAEEENKLVLPGKGSSREAGGHRRSRPTHSRGSSLEGQSSFSLNGGPRITSWVLGNGLKWFWTGCFSQAWCGHSGGAFSGDHLRLRRRQRKRVKSGLLEHSMFELQQLCGGTFLEGAQGPLHARRDRRSERCLWVFSQAGEPSGGILATAARQDGFPLADAGPLVRQTGGELSNHPFLAEGTKAAEGEE